MHHHASFGAFVVIFVLALLAAAVLSPTVRRLAGRILGSLITGAAVAGIAVAALDHNWRAGIAVHHLGPNLPYVWGAGALAMSVAMFAALTSRASSPAISARRESDVRYGRAPGRRSRAGTGR